MVDDVGRSATAEKCRTSPSTLREAQRLRPNTGRRVALATSLGTRQQSALRDMLEHPEGLGWVPRETADKLEARDLSRVLKRGQFSRCDSLCQITDKGKEAMYMVLV